MGQINGYAADINELFRLSSAPSRWHSYLPEGTPFTTASIPANTPTKVKVPTTVISSNNFAVADIGGGDLRVQYQGDAPATFDIEIATGMRSSATLVQTKTRIYKNDTPIPGAYIPRTISTAGDTGAFPMTSVVTLDPLDTISFWVEGDKVTTFTFDGTSIQVREMGYPLTIS